MPKVPKIKSSQYQYIKENVNDEVDFLPADKHQRFLQIYSLFLDGYGQAFPKYPKNKFGISLQCLKKKQPPKEVSDKAGFLHANKHESFLQINTMIFDGDCQASPKFPR